MVHRIAKPLKSNSFFLFGPRGVGKSFLLKTLFLSKKTSESECYFIDLLLPKTRLEYLRDPDRLIRITQQLPKSVKWIIIDEIQKVPSLLDVVHHLIENTSFYFALTGSSARKLKRNAANLLGGRAFVYHLHPYVYLELKENFNLDMALKWGTLPKIFTLHDEVEKRKYLKTYIATFIKEEIQEEQVVRKIEPFINFLEVSAQSDTKIVNYSNIAKDVGVDTKTVQSYFQILEDTLVGFKLNPFHESLRKRQNQNPKFFFFDTGVSRALSRTINNSLDKGTYEYGNRFEQFFILQCIALNNYLEKDFRFSYLRTKDDVEVDLIIERPGLTKIFCEIKSTDKIKTEDFIGLRRISKDYPNATYKVASLDPLPLIHEKIHYSFWLDVLKDIFDL